MKQNMLFRKIGGLLRPRSSSPIARFVSSISDESESIKYSKSVKYHPFDHFPPAVYGGRHVVTMIPGHGIGPEMTGHVKDIFEYMHIPIDFEVIDIKSKQDVLNAIQSIKRNGCAIKGNIEPVPGDFSMYYTPNVAIRKKIDLYASLNECRSYKNIKSTYDDLDLVIIRQNTEGEYSMIEHEAVPGYVEMMRVTTRYNCERIADWAIQFARHHGREKITIVHKAEHIKADRLFLKTAYKLSKDYPELCFDDVDVDKCTRKLVANPHQFDVLLCTNLYGTILCNEVAGLMGGAGFVAGCNYGKNHAVFESATRSQGTLLAGKDVANPTAMLNASINLLHYLGLNEFADLICEALVCTIEHDEVTTKDAGGSASTSEFICRLKENITHLHDETCRIKKEEEEDECNE